MNGIEFLRALRADGRRQAARRGVLHHRERHRPHPARRSEPGADEYIMKPFDGDILDAKFAQVGLL